MTLDLLGCLSRCVEDTNFFEDQKKLDTVYFLMQGLTYRQVAEEIGKQVSYVQRVMDFLKSNGLLYWGRWSPNVYKIGMEKSIAFLSWEERECPLKKNLRHTTYVHQVQAEGIKVMVIYTYLAKEKSEIAGSTGEQITPFYYTSTHLTAPLFRRIELVREFFDAFHSTKDDENIVMGFPSFEAKKIYDDPVTVYACRYAELLPDLAPGTLTDHLVSDFRDYDIDINYEGIRKKLETMKREGIIFPKNALYLKPLYYNGALVRITTKEIYKIMGTFNKFNMLTRMALTTDPEVYYMYIQYPFYQLPEVTEILGELDPGNRMYIETKFVMSDTIYYQWSLGQFSKSSP